MSGIDPVPPSHHGSARTIAALTVVLAVIAGVMVGLVGDRLWMWRHHDGFGEGRFRNMTPRILARFDSELHLNSSQHAAVSHILDSHHQRMTLIFKQISPQVRSEIDAANAEIERVLDPGQREKFHKLKMRMRGPGAPPPNDPR